MSRISKTARKLEQLAKVMQGKERMLIVMQDYPDPDAIASAASLRELANEIADIQCFIGNGGIVGRAENRALVEYLDLNLHQLDTIDPGKFDLIAMVDTQPLTGNNSLSSEHLPDIVIDHHPITTATRKVSFTDIRKDYGSNSTILYEYLAAADIIPETALATALVYGIRSDTHDLGEESINADVTALTQLYPIANTRTLSRIQRGQVPAEYFRMFAVALDNARTYGFCIVTCLGEIDNPDMIGEVADLLLRNKSSTWGICLGFHANKALISLRTSIQGANAGRVARKVVGRNGTGGGHYALAGGQIPMKKWTKTEQRRIEDLVRRRFLKAVGGDNFRGRKLIP